MCVNCADKGNRGRRKKTLEIQATVREPPPPELPKLPAAPILPAKTELPHERAARLAMEASEPLRFAVALSVTPQIEEAAKLAYLTDRTPDELIAFERIVRERHADLIARRPAAIGALVWQAMALQVLNLIVRAPTMAAAQSAASAKALAQVLELVQGGTQPAYSRLIIQVPGLVEDDAARVDAIHAKDAAQVTLQ